MAVGAIVEPAEPMTRIPNIPVFSVGFWNGLYHSPAMLQEMVLNFKRFSNYKPHASINHDDILAAGRVADMRYDGRTLFVDLASVPKSVAQAWNAKQLHSPSIEYWDTRNDRDSKLMSGFRLPNGQSPGLVLRAVTLCGNQPPAVKTLGPMPQAVYEFKDLAPASRRFSQGDRMDKTAMIASLKAADPTLTDQFLAMLDENSLASLLDAKQAGAASAAVDTATPAAPPAGGLDAPGGAPGLDAPGGDPPLGGMLPPNPSKIMADCGNDPTKAMAKMFNDYAAWNQNQAAALTARIKNVTALESQLQTIKAKTEKEHGGIVNDRIKRFMDEVASKRVPPVQLPIINRLLRALDPVTVRKFSDGKKMGSALDEEMANIEALPIVPQLLRKFQDDSAAKQSVGVGAGIGDKLTIAKRVLNATEEGKRLIEPMEKRYATPAAA